MRWRKARRRNARWRRIWWDTEQRGKARRRSVRRDRRADSSHKAQRRKTRPGIALKSKAWRRDRSKARRSNARTHGNARLSVARHGRVWRRRARFGVAKQGSASAGYGAEEQGNAALLTYFGVRLRSQIPKFDATSDEFTRSVPGQADHHTLLSQSITWLCVFLENFEVHFCVF